MKKKKKKKEREEEVKKGQRRNGHFALAMSEESPKKYRVGPQPAINQVALDEGMEGSCKRRGKEDRGNSSSNSRDQQQRPAGRDEETREREAIPSGASDDGEAEFRNTRGACQGEYF